MSRVSSSHVAQSQHVNAQISQNSSSPLHEGSVVQGRVLSSDGAGAYTVSLAGRQVQVRSLVSLAPGEQFTAQIRLSNGAIRLVLQNSEQGSHLLPSEQRMPALLSALGLPSGAESERLVAFVQTLGIKIQPEQLKKALVLARALGGREDAAALSVLLDDKGLESSADAVKAVLGGGADGEKPGKHDEKGRGFGGQPSDEQRHSGRGGQLSGEYTPAEGHESAAACDAITAAPVAFFADYAALADRAAAQASWDESRAGAMTACNQLYRHREAEDSNLHWIFLPFEWEYHGYTGVIRILFDCARKKIARIAVNMKNNMAQNKFIVYYTNQGVERAEFCCTPPAEIGKRSFLEATFSHAIQACTAKTVPVAYNEYL